MAPVDSRLETMYFDVVEPVFYIYSKWIVFRLNYLGNSFKIFTPGDVWNTMWPVNTPRNETLTQCWPNFGPLVFDRLLYRKRWREMNGTHRLRQTERSEVEQHVPTSVYKGET